MSRATAPIVLGVVAGLLAAAPVATADHRPPRTELRAGSLGQRGLLYDASWTSCGGIDCVSWQCVDCRPDFPKRALALGEGRHDVRIVLHTPRRPRNPVLRYWDGVDDGGPVGAARRLRFELDHPAERRWLVRSRTPRLPPDAYLALRAGWPDVDLPQDRQHAGWGFHLAD